MDSIIETLTSILPMDTIISFLEGLQDIPVLGTVIGFILGLIG